MTNEIIFNYVALFIILEIIEVTWQKAITLLGMFAKMYVYYKKNIFLFLGMHPTFYYAIAFTTLCDYHAASIFIVLAKGVDIAFKIAIMQRLFEKKDLSQEMMILLSAPMPRLLPYIGIIVYPVFIVAALIS